MDIEQMLRSAEFDEYAKAVEFLYDFRKEDAVKILLGLLAERRNEFRCRAIELIPKFCPPLGEEIAIRLLDDADSTIRANAMYILRGLSCYRAIPKIEERLLDDSCAIVRNLAAGTLGKLGDEKSISYLRACIETDQGTNHEGQPIRITAQRAISKIRDRIKEEAARENK